MNDVANEVGEMVKMLAGAPKEQRRQMLQQRMDMFLAMPDEKRVEAMRGMIQAIGGLPADRKRALIATRTAVVAAYPADQRKVLLQSRMKAGMGLPEEVDQEDMKAIEAALPDLSPELRANFLATRQELMKAMGVSVPAPTTRSGTPTHHGRPMSLKGFFRKRYVCDACGYAQTVGG